MIRLDESAALGCACMLTVLHASSIVLYGMHWKGRPEQRRKTSQFTTVSIEIPIAPCTSCPLLILQHKLVMRSWSDPSSSTVKGLARETNWWPRSDAVFCPTLASSLTFTLPLCYRRCVEKVGHTVVVSISTWRSQLQLLFFQLLTRHSFAPPTSYRVKTCTLIISAVLCIAPLHYSYLLCSSHCWLHAVTKLAGMIM